MLEIGKKYEMLRFVDFIKVLQVTCRGFFVYLKHVNGCHFDEQLICKIILQNKMIKKNTILSEQFQYRGSIIMDMASHIHGLVLLLKLKLAW